jgi:uncharacterized protein (DUF1330 family)
VRGAEPVVAEGEAASLRIAVVEFDSMEPIRRWYASPEYAKALRLRTAALERRLVFLDGVDRTNIPRDSFHS